MSYDPPIQHPYFDDLDDANATISTLTAELDKLRGILENMKGANKRYRTRTSDMRKHMLKAQDDIADLRKRLGEAEEVLGDAVEQAIRTYQTHMTNQDGDRLALFDLIDAGPACTNEIIDDIVDQVCGELHDAIKALAARSNAESGEGVGDGE